MPTIPKSMRLTKRSVEQLPIPDGDCVCLGRRSARPRCSTAEVWSQDLDRAEAHTQAGRSIRLKLGRADELTAEQARDEAKRIVSRDRARRATRRPIGARRRLAERERRDAPTLAQLARGLGRGSASVLAAGDRDRDPAPGRAVHPAWPWGACAPARSSSGTSRSCTRSLPADPGATAIVSTLRAAYALGPRPRRRLAERSRPTRPSASQMNPEQRRERFPVNGELQRLVQVLHSRDSLEAKFYLFLFLTGARRGEAENMRWVDVDLEAGRLDQAGGSDQAEEGCTACR